MTTPFRRRGAAISACVASAALALSGCLEPIRVSGIEDARTSKSQMDSWPLARLLPAERFDALEVRAFVYRPRELPLNEFFRKLERGDFAQAVKSLQLPRPPAEVDSKALRLLIGKGFIPVLVDVVNTGREPADLGRLHFDLVIGGDRLGPIPSRDVPAQIARLNPKALAADAYNAAALIIDVAEIVAVIAAIVFLSGGHGGSARSGGFSTPDFSDAGAGEFVNSTVKTVYVDPADLLWSPRVLPPNGDARGLLFFRSGASDVGTPRLATTFDPARVP
jgi:hypothetical protein